jgi:hypothetical protein
VTASPGSQFCASRSISAMPKRRSTLLVTVFRAMSGSSQGLMVWPLRIYAMLFISSRSGAPTFRYSGSSSPGPYPRSSRDAQSRISVEPAVVRVPADRYVVHQTLYRGAMKTSQGYAPEDASRSSSWPRPRRSRRPGRTPPATPGRTSPTRAARSPAGPASLAPSRTCCGPAPPMPSPAGGGRS